MIGREIRTWQIGIPISHGMYEPWIFGSFRFVIHFLHFNVKKLGKFKRHIPHAFLDASKFGFLLEFGAQNALFREIVSLCFSFSVTLTCQMVPI